MDYVAMAIFDPKTSDRILSMRLDIKKIVLKENAGTWIPHITLGIYDASSLPTLIEHTRWISSSHQCIHTFFSSIGQFFHSPLYPSTDVFYLAPALPPDLVSLYADFHSTLEDGLTLLGQDYRYYGGTPTLHCTLAICDTQSFKAAVSYLYDNFATFPVTIIGIQITDMEQNVISTLYFSNWR